MSVAIGAGWVVFVALWHSADLPVPTLLGARADIVLVVILVWAYVRSPEDAIILALIGGLTLDLLSDQPTGISVLALLPAAVAGSVKGARMLDTEWLSTVALAVVVTLAYHVVLLALLSMTGGEPPLLETLRGQALPAAVLNALIAPLLYLLLWAASFDLRLSRRQLRTSD